MTLPEYSEVRLDSADLTEVQPTEYRADLVVLLLDGEPVLGIIAEVQLTRDERKRFVWPAYAVNLYARLECPVHLLVVTAEESIARWAAKPIDFGNGSRFAPLVLGPRGIPEIVDEKKAALDPELAVLSAMAHGQDADIAKSARIAAAAQSATRGLDSDRSQLYFDLIFHSLSEAARRALQTMLPFKYEYQSEFARKNYAHGLAEGKAAGQADLVERLLSRRFGKLSDDVRGRISTATTEELQKIAERLLSAQTLQEALGPQ
jgi:hypothetical protein